MRFKNINITNSFYLDMNADTNGILDFAKMFNTIAVTENLCIEKFYIVTNINAILDEVSNIENHKKYEVKLCFTCKRDEHFTDIETFFIDFTDTGTISNIENGWFGMFYKYHHITCVQDLKLPNGLGCYALKVLMREYLPDVADENDRWVVQAVTPLRVRLLNVKSVEELASNAE